MVPDHYSVPSWPAKPEYGPGLHGPCLVPIWFLLYMVPTLFLPGLSGAIWFICSQYVIPTMVPMCSPLHNLLPYMVLNYTWYLLGPALVRIWSLSDP